MHEDYLHVCFGTRLRSLILLLLSDGRLSSEEEWRHSEPSDYLYTVYTVPTHYLHSIYTLSTQYLLTCACVCGA